MPFLDQDTQTAFLAGGDKTPPPAPSTLDSLAATFRQDTAIGSLAYAPRMSPDDPSFSAYPQIHNDPKWAPYADQFVRANNQADVDATKAAILQEQRDKATLAATPGFTGFLMGAGAQFVDPINWLPIGGAVKAGRGGFSIARSALKAGAEFGAATAAQEYVLQAAQADRTWEEGAINVGSGIVLGAVFGTVGAALLNRAGAVEARMLEASAGKAYARILDEHINPVPSPDVSIAKPVETTFDRLARATPEEVPAIRESVSTPEIEALRERVKAAEVGTHEHDVLTQDLAAAVDRQIQVEHELAQQATVPAQVVTGNSSVGGAAVGAEVARAADLADYQIAGRMSEVLGKLSSFMNPVLRSTQRLSADAAQIMRDMTGFAGTYTNAMEEGRALTPGGAVRDLMASKFAGRVSAAERGMEDLYREMKRSGINMKRNEWEERVGQAMRTNDTDPSNDYVSRAAKAWREKVVDPFLKEAQALGMIPEDITVKTAASYFSRVYDRQLLIAHAEEFYNRMIPHFEQRLAAAWEDQSKSLANRLERLQGEINLLKTDPEAAARMLSEIETRLAQMREGGDLAANAQIADLRRQANEARVAGDTKKARELDKQADGMLTADEKRERQSLVYNRNLLMNSAHGLDLKSEKILNSLADLNEKAIASLDRLVQKARMVEREWSKYDDVTLANKVAAQRNAFAAELAKADRAREAVTSRREAIDKEMASLQERLAKPAGEGENAAAKIAELRPALEKLSALRERIVAAEAREASSVKRLAAINDRLANAESLDGAAMRQELLDAISEVQHIAADRVLAKGERAQRLMEKLKSLDKDKEGKTITDKLVEKRQGAIDRLKQGFEDKWGRRIDETAPSAEKYRSFAKEIVDDLYNKLTDRNYGVSGADAEWRTPISRGPLKERSAFAPDSLLAAPIPGVGRGFLEDNVRSVMHRYARIMAAETALTERFGRADMRDQIEQVANSYKALTDMVREAPDAQSAWDGIGKGGKAPKTKEEILLQLDRDMKGAIEDLQGVRDQIRGNYKVGENLGTWGRVVRSLTAFNYIRSMGGVVLSNLTELYRPVMVHGLAPFMDLAGKALTGQMAGIRASVQEAKLAGLVAERIMHHRLATWGEFADPLAHGTWLERAMENTARVANKWSGLAAFTDFEEAFAATMSQNRIIEALLNGKGAADEKLLAALNIGAGYRLDVAKELAQHAEKVDGVWVANTEKWTDQKAVDTYRQGVLADVNSIIVQRRPGDLPLFASTPTGRLLLQFRAYNMAAHQKVMIRGFQEGPAGMVSGIIAMTSMGAFVAALQAWRGGQDRWERFLQSAQNPGYLIGEGLDKSGLFPMMFDASNTLDSGFRASGFSFNPLKKPLLYPFPQASQSGDTNRFSPTNTFLNNVLGPTASLAEDVWTAGQYPSARLQGQSPPKGSVNAAQRIMPLGSYLGMKELLQILAGDSPYMRH